jgi:carbonic anhydrase
MGDIFSIRIAGNFVNDDILGSMEFATKLAGSKLIVVLGHTRCGAIKGACDDAKLGHLTGLIEKLKPAVNAVKTPSENRNSSNEEFVQNVADTNVKMTIEQIKNRSEVIRELLNSGEIGIVGAMYNVEDGVVTFQEILQEA